MPQLLLELLSEEIPARMQGQAARDLERMARERLAEQGLLPAALKTFAGPRRLTLVAEGLLPAQADRTEERKGPRVGAPEQAIEGFLRSTGLTRDQLTERDGAKGALAPHFIVTANIEAIDGGATIAEGAARVLTARLKDARYFWEEDRKAGNFERWLERLKGVTFHAKLGTMYERVERIEALAREIAPLVGANPDMAAKGARLAKADLASAMVGEFPELQGIMGGYYAREAGLPDEMADAIRNHYKPQGPGDAVPIEPVSVAVALSDKLDTLVGFFSIDERPTGSRDPYALRRAALGIIRTVLENHLRLSLRLAVFETFLAIEKVHALRQLHTADAREAIAREIAAFLADRLKVQLREEGRRHDLVDAVFALGDDDLVRIVARVEALDGFLKTEDGANLLAGYRRAANILKAETKKHPDEADSYAGPVDPALLTAPEEQALAAALASMRPTLASSLQAERFDEAMTALASLRGPVDAFFDRVLVNADDAAVRKNRLRLLSQVQRDMEQVADFSQVAG